MASIAFYREKCIGCDVCETHSPERWTISKADGKAVLKGSKLKNGVFVVSIDEHEIERNGKCASECPMRIIKVFSN